MIYVMSDIHGAYEKYKKMLELIRFFAEDELYILGDVIDRGEGGIDILLDVMQRPNVHVLMGNHEDMAAVQFQYELRPESIKNLPLLQEIFSSWILHNGGRVTYDAFMKRTDEEKQQILQYIRSMPLHQSLTVNGQKYFLAHTIAETYAVEEAGGLDKLTGYDYLWGEPDYEEVYADDTIIVTGHTPTDLIDPDYLHKIYRKNNHIALDCAAGYEGCLGCVCLDSGEEFYA